jgi:archaellum component FlaC
MMIDAVNNRVTEMDDMIDRVRGRTKRNEDDIEEIMNTLKDLQKKIQDKVACSTFDKEINYLKSLLTHLRK